MDITLVDLGKFILYISIAICLIVLAIQLARLLSSLTDNMKGLKKTVDNFGVLSDELVKDHKMVWGAIESLSNAGKKVGSVISTFSDKISKPLAAVSSLLTTLGGFAQIVNKKIKREE